MRIEENTFLVAGGGSGLGEATARMLVDSGARVVVADLKGGAPEGGRFVETDVTDEGSVRAAVNAALEVGGATRRLKLRRGRQRGEGPRKRRTALARFLREGRAGQPHRHLQRHQARRRGHGQQ